MPIRNGVGCSEHTIYKQEIFKQIVHANIQMWKSALSNPRHFEGNYTYVDMNAGPGVVPGFDINGSPIIALEELEMSGIRYFAHLFENNISSFTELRKTVDNNSSVCVYPFPNAEMLDFVGTRGKRNRIPGLIYSDENGVVPFDVLAEFSKYFETMDILIHFSATSIKRVKHYDGYGSLMENLKLIQRKNVSIQEGQEKHQWSFLYMTNHPKAFEWKKIGLYNLRSERGKEIFDRLNKTKKERETDGQATLFDLPGIS